MTRLIRLSYCLLTLYLASCRSERVAFQFASLSPASDSTTSPIPKIPSVASHSNNSATSFASMQQQEPLAKQLPTQSAIQFKQEQRVMIPKPVETNLYFGKTLSNSQAVTVKKMASQDIGETSFVVGACLIVGGIVAGFIIGGSSGLLIGVIVLLTGTLLAGIAYGGGLG